jgi:hypothetical protein
VAVVVQVVLELTPSREGLVTVALALLPQSLGHIFSMAAAVAAVSARAQVVQVLVVRVVVVLVAGLLRVLLV